MFSRPNKWEHASFGRNKRSVELARKNLGDLYCKIFMQHENKKTSSAAKKKHYRPASVLKKIIAQSRLKNICLDYFTTDVDCCFFYSIAE